MNNDLGHTRHDRDLELARQYGQIRNDDSSEGVKKDPLFSLLARVRATSQQVEEDLTVRGREASWQAISMAIRGASEPDTHLFRLPISRHWLRLAAAILLGLFLSILFIVQPFESEPHIVAEASATLSTVELDDGSRVTLRPHSRITELSSEENHRAYSLTGDALFEVEPLQNRTFSVLAGNGRVIVTGTTFHISARAQRSSVHLLEGRVRFETTDGSQSVDLTPGDASTVDEQMQILDPYPFQRDEIIGWTQNRLIFNNRLVSHVLDELEFHFGIMIDAPRTVQTDSLGGSISLESLKTALEDLETVLGGHFEQTGEKRYRFRPGNETNP